MSVSIVFAGIVMLIIRIVGARCSTHLSMSLSKPSSQSLIKTPAVMCIAETKIKPSLKLAFLEELLNFISDANIFSAFLRFKPEIFGMRTETFRCFQYPISKCMQDVPTYMTTDRGYVDSHKFTGCLVPR